MTITLVGIYPLALIRHRREWKNRKFCNIFNYMFFTFYLAVSAVMPRPGGVGLVGQILRDRVNQIHTQPNQ